MSCSHQLALATPQLSFTPHTHWCRSQWTCSLFGCSSIFAMPFERDPVQYICLDHVELTPLSPTLSFSIFSFVSLIELVVLSLHFFRLSFLLPPSSPPPTNLSPCWPSPFARSDRPRFTLLPNHPLFLNIFFLVHFHPSHLLFTPLVLVRKITNLTQFNKQKRRTQTRKSAAMSLFPPSFLSSLSSTNTTSSNNPNVNVHSSNTDE